MGKIDYQKILKNLVQNDHHALGKIERVINDAKSDEDYYVRISVDKILNDREWTSSEKERLLRLFSYDKSEQELEYTDKYDHKQKMDAAVHMIKFNNLSGFTAYMNCFKDIESHYAGIDISKDEAYRDILDTINNQTSEEYNSDNKAKYSKIFTKEQELEFIKIALSILSEENKKRLCAAFYEAYCLKEVNNKSIFINIIKTGNIELIDEYVPFVDNISAYISYAVDTGNIEVVRHFIVDLGADINYYPKDVIYGLLTPLKRAITNNDYEMFEFLYDNGADVNLSVLEEDFIDNLHNTPLNIFDRWNHVHPKSCKKSDKDVKDLKYLRTSTPLEYATTISNYEDGRYHARYLISFEGCTNYIDNKVGIDNEKPTEEQINRAKIINSLFEKADKTKGFNATNLICTALATQDILNINKYIDYIITNKMEVDFAKIFNLFLSLDLEQYDILVDKLKKFIEEYSEKPSTTKLQLFNMYLDKIHVKEGFVLNNFTSTLLNSIDDCDRKSIILMPYVKDVETTKKLMELGFDISQTDKDGKNILFGLLHYRYNRDKLTTKEKELFEFLTTINKETEKRLIDIAHKDNDNKNALYYALQTLNTEDEWMYGFKEKVYTYTDFEDLVADFINILSEEEINNKDIMEVLETRMTEYFSYNSVRSNRIHADFVYQHHQKLMKALRRKMIFSDKIYQEIFKRLYPDEEDKIELLNDRVQVEPSLDFLYEVLDKNTKSQKISIADTYAKYINFLNKTNSSFEEYLCIFKKLISDIDELKKFYKENVTKRYNVDKYLEYVKNKYNVSYNDFSSYILKMIIFGIRKFGSDKLSLILELCPFFDVNTVIYDEDIKMPYYEHLNEVLVDDYYDNDENSVELEDRFEAENLKLDYNDNILFTGALIHYGILINDIELVKYLQSIGAKIELIIEGEEHTWDYVNSTAMDALLEQEVDPRNLAELDEEERNYLLGL